MTQYLYRQLPAFWCYYEAHYKAGSGRLGRKPLHDIPVHIYSVHEYLLGICFVLGPKAMILCKIRLGPQSWNQDSHKASTQSSGKDNPIIKQMGFGEMTGRSSQQPTLQTLRRMLALIFIAVRSSQRILSRVLNMFTFAFWKDDSGCCGRRISIL